MRIGPTDRFLVVALATLFTCEFHPQTTTSGALTAITDQTNAVVPNAQVEIKDLAKDTTLSTKSDHEGLHQSFFLAWQIHAHRDARRFPRRTPHHRGSTRASGHSERGFENDCVASIGE